MTPYEELANAIILQAVKDYRDALKNLKKYPNDTDSQNTKKECEAFFRSAWYNLMTKVDGKMLISALQKEVGV